MTVRIDSDVVATSTGDHESPMRRHLKRWFARPGSQRGPGPDLHKPRPDRRDVARMEVAEGVTIDVFWKILPIGRGPALSLYVIGHEVLKFDCFGPQDGHFHAEFILAGSPADDRIFMGELTVEAQIDRALFEIERNISYFLQRHPNADIRGFRFPKERVSGLIPSLRERLLEYQKRVEAFDAAHQTL